VNGRVGSRRWTRSRDAASSWTLRARGGRDWCPGPKVDWPLTPEEAAARDEVNRAKLEKGRTERFEPFLSHRGATGEGSARQEQEVGVAALVGLTPAGLRVRSRLCRCCSACSHTRTSKRDPDFAVVLVSES
jgi:hypothetical protein